MTLIDGLTHATPDGAWFGSRHDASVDRLLREMDAADVERAVVVGMWDAAPNAFIQTLCTRWPDRLIACSGFNPAAHDTANEAGNAARHELVGSGFAAVKLHPRLNRYDLFDPRCLAALDEIALCEKPLPVWICGFLHHAAAPLSRPPVETFHALAVRYPNITFVVCHSAGVSAIALAEAVSSLPNVFLDLSYTLARYEGFSLIADLQRLAARFERRIIWGSDFPEIDIPRAARLLAQFLHPMPKEKWEPIQRGNLCRILGVE